MQQVTFLGPWGATFTMLAAELFSNRHSIPFVDNSKFDYIAASSNGQVVPQLISGGGYGILACETDAQGRVSESLESLMMPCAEIDDHEEIPFKIIEALRIPISFSLMVKPGVNIADVQGIVSHQKSFGACKNFVKDSRLVIEEVSSNGEAARRVYEDVAYSKYAALGPGNAASLYDLQILKKGCEDKQAVTTFYLLGPGDCNGSLGLYNRAIICFQPKRESGALMRCLEPFAIKHLNSTRIHSRDVESGGQDIALEVEVPQEKITDFARAVAGLRQRCERVHVYGPFAVSEHVF